MAYPELLQQFCPSLSKGLTCHSLNALIDESQVESDVEAVDDEVVDVDIHPLKQFCTERGWEKLQSICMYNLLIRITLCMYTTLSSYIGRTKRKQWECKACCVATTKMDMIMCDGCLVWFHW